MHVFFSLSNLGKDHLTFRGIRRSYVYKKKNNNMKDKEAKIR
jgi:hypothetical protein